MPTGQFDTPAPNKVIEALQKLGNQRPTGINLRVPGQSQHYLGTYLGPEAVDANLSLVRLHGGDTIRFVPKLQGITLVAGNIIKLEKSSVLPLHIVGVVVGDITLAFNQAVNVAKPGAPTSYSHGTAASTAVSVSWSAGVDHFGSGLSYQVYVNGKFFTATGTGVLNTTLNNLTPGTTYNSYVVAIDGAGNQSSTSNQISWTTTGTPPHDPGTTVTTKYKGTLFRSYNHNGNFEHDDWHDGNAYQGANDSSNQLGLIFFDDDKMRADTLGNDITAAKLTMTYAHWYNNSGGTAILGWHEYNSPPGKVSLSNVHINWNQVSHAGSAFTIDMGVATGMLFQDGTARGISVGQGTNGNHTYYGYTYGLGTHVPYLTITYTQT